MSATRVITINGSGGAWTPIAASIPARSVQIVEDGSVAAQGLQVQYPADNFTTTSTVLYGQQPIAIVGAGKDGLAGLPTQNPGNATTDFNYRAADVYCQVKSATNAGTTVRVVETETT